MILLTGATGFVGQHATALLPCVPLNDEQGQMVDLRDMAAIRRALAPLSFDTVLHLAGQSFVPASFQDPLATYEVNFLGTARLFLALQERGFTGRVLYVSSGDVYATVPETALPLTEDRVPSPRSPYAVSKVAAEALCYQVSHRGPFEVVVARPFNHIGPGQSPRFAIADFARQVMRIKAGRQAELVVGDLDVTRDFTDVRDVVRAYEALLAHGRKGEIYNVCSGREERLGDLLDQLLQGAQVQAPRVVATDRLRPTEQRRAYGSAKKIQSETGWRPIIPITQSLTDLLHYWEHNDTL